MLFTSIFVCDIISNYKDSCLSINNKVGINSMPKKVLFVATVVKAHINVFHKPYLKWFRENGFETHVCACNDYENPDECVIPDCDFYYNIPFSRSPFRLSNIKAYIQLKKIINSNHFDIIHCHTPTAGVLTRIAAVNARKNGSRVLYTAHGFHFYKNAPFYMWAFYPIEKILSDYADAVITINHYDYELALKKHFCRDGNVFIVHGTGVDTKKFISCNIDKAAKRREFGIPDNAFVVLSAAELNKNKNYTASIRAFAKADIKNSYYVICGEGKLKNHYIHLSQTLGVSDRVIFAGYRSDMPQMYRMSDVFIFTSKREGLGNACIEAMASGLPLVVSDSRGTEEYAENGRNAFVCNADDYDGFAEALRILSSDSALYSAMSAECRRSAEKYDIENSVAEMADIYREKIRIH